MITTCTPFLRTITIRSILPWGEHMVWTISVVIGKRGFSTVIRIILFMGAVSSMAPVATDGVGWFKDLQRDGYFAYELKKKKKKQQKQKRKDIV
jgi:hypothetical protein